ncbi:hypothetical protein KCH_55450 [Kitasatospora cheerisanensis KCTC 2395]|uniref:Uncharacterized protein n=1 Tax=Kitasatospora cheerisanensis KCTC 2395 TaxID=1348663 RepID=A0A066YXG8_9ACTN|nr:hypothetical protein KCH_55450 [Kitasatospora cheerisanensis KCTC 2395]
MRFRHVPKSRSPYPGSRNGPLRPSRPPRPVRGRGVIVPVPPGRVRFAGPRVTVPRGGRAARRRTRGGDGHGSTRAQSGGGGRGGGGAAAGRVQRGRPQRLRVQGGQCGRTGGGAARRRREGGGHPGGGRRGAGGAAATPGPGRPGSRRAVRSPTRPG